MNIDNKKILIGAGVVVVGYLLWKKSQSKVTLNPIDSMRVECEKQNRNWDSVEKFCGMKNSTIEDDRAMAITYYKTLPDKFTIKLDSERNVNYTKNSNLEFYKTPYTINSDSGVQPIKISGAEFSDAYRKFKNQDLPKSSFLDSFIKDGGVVIYN
jgi:hypothetical protein